MNEDPDAGPATTWSSEPCDVAAVDHPARCAESGDPLDHRETLLWAICWIVVWVEKAVGCLHEHPGTGPLEAVDAMAPRLDEGTRARWPEFVAAVRKEAEVRR